MAKQKEHPGREIFRLVESVQGFAFISDAIEDMPPKEALDVVEGAEPYQRKALAITQAFLRRHGRLRSDRRGLSEVSRRLHSWVVGEGIYTDERKLKADVSRLLGRRGRVASVGQRSKGGR